MVAKIRAVFCYLALGVCALAFGAYSSSSAFVNGMSLVPGPMGYAVGSMLAAMLVWSGISGGLMSHAFGRRAWGNAMILMAQWLGSLALVLTMSVGFVATARTELVGNKQQAIDGYNRADADYKRINAELQAADSRGASLKRTADLRQDLKRAESALQAGRPAKADAQADTLSWVLRKLRFPVSSDTIGRGLPLWLAIGPDLAFSGCIMAFGMIEWPKTKKAKVTKRRKAKRKSPPRRPAVILPFPETQKAVSAVAKTAR